MEPVWKIRSIKDPYRRGDGWDRPEEMAKNFTDEVAETEIIIVKMAETEEVGNSVANFSDFF